VNWRFVFAMARRELRSARRRFALYGACMAIGIAVVVGLHALRATVRDAVDLQSQGLLGADLRLASRAPLEDDVLARLDRLGPDALSTITRFGSMALAERTGRTRLVDVQAIEGGYPFYGVILTEPPERWALLQHAEHEALVDPSLLIQLDARVGDTLVLGESRFRIAGEIRKAPGSFGLQTQVAPRVFIAKRYLEETGLVQLGSLVEHLRYLKVPLERLEPWLASNEPALEAARVRYQTVAGYQEDMSQSFSALTRYLGLVGLAALALGSIGVASGVRVFVREKLDAVAVLRSLGARPRDVIAVYSLLAVALGAAAGLAGVVLCLPLLWTFPTLMRDVLPVDVALRLEPAAIATGVILGLWATGVCALGPLIDLGGVAPLRALRRDFGAEVEVPRRGRTFVLVALGLSGLAASVWQAPRLLVGLGFAAGLALAIAVLAGCARLAAESLRRHAPRRAAYWLRQGIANLFRPRNHTLPTTVAIGFALFLVATLHAVQHSVLAQIALDTSDDRPNLVLFDVQPDQAAPLADFLDERGARTVESAPLVSARLGAVRGVASTARLEEGELPRELRWALRREYRLTYRPELRDTETIIAGRWWNEDEVYPDGVMPVSIEEDLAQRLELAIGDRITWQVQGVPVESKVTSIRSVDWGKLATNFFVVMPPAALENAPQSAVVLAHLADADARAELQRDLVGEFPNVSALDATVILRAVDATMAQVSTAIRVLALFTLGTGLAILLAAASAARSERMREALLLRVLGASIATVRRIQATEALALGVLAAGVGSVLSVAAAWTLVYFLFELPFDPPWLDLVMMTGATLAITALLGSLGSRGARELSPQAALRASERLGTGAA
jgi:putative ABC transport system permease protein